MKINKDKDGARLVIAPVGRIDTITAPELEATLEFDGIEELIFDLAAVEYISSAGLRVLLASQKKMAGRSMVVSNAAPTVKEVFDITGFSDIFTFA